VRAAATGANEQGRIIVESSLTHEVGAFMFLRETTALL
jgi:hypothetical protein